MIELSIVIVTFNAERELASCLSALAKTTALGDVQVIISDNASTDGTRAILEEFPEVELLRNEDNLGFGRANNRALEKASGELVLFLNPDTAVRDGAVEKMVSILKARPQVGALGPLLRNQDGSVQISFGRSLSFTAEFFQKCLNLGYGNGKGPLKGYVERRSLEERNPDWVSGACLMTRREILERLGGFDERFFMYAEDVDLCARIRDAGFEVLYSPAAEVLHLGGRSAESHPEIARVESQRSRLTFYSKHYGKMKTRIFKLYLASKLSLAWLLRPREHPLQRQLFAVLREF